MATLSSLSFPTFRKGHNIGTLVLVKGCMDDLSRYPTPTQGCATTRSIKLSAAMLTLCGPDRGGPFRSREIYEGQAGRDDLGGRCERAAVNVERQQAVGPARGGIQLVACHDLQIKHK